LVSQLAAILRAHEGTQDPYNDEERRVIKTVVEAVRLAEIARREKEHPLSHQTRARLAAQEVAAQQQREAAAQARARVPQSAYERPLETLALSEKVLGHLQRNGVTNVGQVMERIAQGDEALLVLTGVGVKALSEIKAAVEASDLHFLDLEGTSEAAVVVESPVPEAAIEAVVEVAAEAVEQVEVAAVEEAVVEALPAAPEEAAEAEAPGVVAVEAEAPAAAVVEAEVAAEAPAAPRVSAPAVVPIKELFTVPFVEEEDEDLESGSLRRQKKGKRKQRTVFYDDEKGETFVVRKRRRGGPDSWDEYAD